MGRITKSFKEYLSENDGFPKIKKLKKESRHNFKTHLMDVIEEDWDDIEDDLTGVYSRKRHVKGTD